VAADFGDQLERHRTELLTHCYRMLGSRQDAEDVTQETLLRAWRGREAYAGEAAVRTWLFRIATNASLDLLRARRRRPVVLETEMHPPTTGPASPAAVTWLEPCPDKMLGSDDRLIARETVELVMITAIQHLPERQRAVFALRDVLGWLAAEVAAALDTTTAAVNSAQQRARATLRAQLPAERSDCLHPDRRRAGLRGLRRVAAAHRGGSDHRGGHLPGRPGPGVRAARPPDR
jgi:RNA polymerase sigma-70 factor, ECF subfamily